MVENICKLCNKKSILIGKSHIIPNFMYDGLFDDNRKMLIATLKDLAKKPQIAQSGFFDKNILCKNCETMFSKNERYASHFFKGTTKSSISFVKRRSQEGQRTIFVSGLDYRKIKLFFLSILWRAHISENKFFKNVKLDNSNEFEIRKMLMENNSGSDHEYKVSILIFQNSASELIRLLFNPTVETIGTGIICIFFINGYCYFIDLKPKSSFRIFEKVYINEKGEIDIPIVHCEMATKLLVSFGIDVEIAKNYVTA